MNRGPIRRPTEHAAIRVACRSLRPLPPVECLLEAYLVAHHFNDQEGMTLAAHRAVRAATPEIGT